MVAGIEGRKRQDSSIANGQREAELVGRGCPSLENSPFLIFVCFYRTVFYSFQDLRQNILGQKTGEEGRLAFP